MSKRAYPVWDYPSNTKTNPIPPTKSSQGRAPSNPTVAVPQGQTSQTTARAGSNVPQRGQNARQMEHGVYPEMPIPRMPKKIHFKKKAMSQQTVDK